MKRKVANYSPFALAPLIPATDYQQGGSAGIVSGMTRDVGCGYSIVPARACISRIEFNPDFCQVRHTDVTIKMGTSNWWTSAITTRLRRDNNETGT